MSSERKTARMGHAWYIQRGGIGAQCEQSDCHNTAPTSVHVDSVKVVGGYYCLPLRGGYVVMQSENAR